jgi:hypothetical protein
MESEFRNRYLVEPSREVPLIAEVDVLVVGGGPAGVSAAVAAAQAGARTMLVERHGFLGGMWTAGLVTTLAGFNLWLRPYSRCVAGVPGEWLRKATAAGFAEDNDSWVLNSDAEGMKLVADEMLATNGVKCLFHTWCATAIMDGSRVIGAMVENVEGRGAILARVTVDCTGNGDVIARSGANWIKGNTLQPMTVPFRIGNLNLDPELDHIAPRYIPIGPEPVELTGQILAQWGSPRSDVKISYDDMRSARLRGELPPFGGPWFGGLYKDIVWVNSTRIIGDASIAEELTRAEIEGRRNCFQLLAYFKKHLPGFEDARILHTSPQIGIRETRRLVGRYTLTGDDIRQAADFDDGIGLGCWAIDIHPTDQVALHSMYVPRPFKIPYRSLLPQNVDGLLAAGRCISVDREALASVRVGAQCGVTGQAAGAAAALCARNHIEPRELDASTLLQVLREQGAILDVPEAAGM